MQTTNRLPLILLPSLSMQYRYLAAAAALLSVVTSSSHASITMNLGAGVFFKANGTTPVDEGTLFQLIDLGPNGVFDPIDLRDGNISQLGQWVSGDDKLITATYQSTPDYASLAAFDLGSGNSPHFGAGQMDRQIKFDGLTELLTGTHFGIRWFPTLTADDYYHLGSITLLGGEPYGQFTRQSNPLNNGSLWIVPNDPTFSFGPDPLGTPGFGGADPDSAGKAGLTVISNVPEPATAGLALLGGFAVLGLRRRRH